MSSYNNILILIITKKKFHVTVALFIRKYCNLFHAAYKRSHLEVLALLVWILFGVSDDQQKKCVPPPLKS
jgi:hypothetical protein